MRLFLLMLYETSTSVTRGFHTRQANYSLYNVPQLRLYIDQVVSRGRQSGPSDTHDGCHFRAISKCTSWPMSNPSRHGCTGTSGDKYTGLATIFPRARGNQACSVPHLPPGADVRSLSRPRCCQTRIGTCARVRGKWCSCCSRTAPLDWCNPDGWRSPPSWRVCLPDAGTNRHDWLGWRVAALGYVLTTLAELRGEVLGCELSKGELDGNLKTWRFADGVLGWEFQVTCLIE